MNSHRSRWLAAALLMVAISSGSIGGAQQPVPPVAQGIGQGIGPQAAAQIVALMQEKRSRTLTQRKIDSRLLYESKIAQGQAIAAGVSQLETGILHESDGRVVVDVRARISDGLLAQMRALGADVISAELAYDSVRLQAPAARLEAIAALPQVSFIQPKQEAITQGTMVRTPFDPSVPDSAERRRLHRQEVAEAVRKALGAGARQGEDPITNVGSVNSQGDKTHLASATRTKYGATGAGVKIGVLSDSVDGLASAQALGDLGPVTVLPGQAGNGSGEGTAMLEIIHDLVPGAQLYFATAFSGLSSFAQNIRDLRTAGCDIIVDDVFYFNETPFQDGQTYASPTGGALIAQAVKDVVAAGALYFSSAGNEGNKNDGTSGTWEGDFVDGGDVGAPILEPGRVHQFAVGQNYDVLTSTGFVNTLHWADPLGGSANDYDLFRLDGTGATLLAASTNDQSGAQDPYKQITAGSTGNRLVIVKFAGSGVFLHLSTLRGVLSVSTSGEIHGHNAVSSANAFGVAATPAQAPGPNPNPFNGGNAVEAFSSDGPRRIFFTQAGAAITPGNFLSTGGQVLNKPDLTAADGVSVTGSGGLFPTTFYGTSAAAPHAGALAALVKAMHPGFTPDQIRTALVNSAIDIEALGFDRDAGAGIIMAGDFATYNAVYMTPACLVPGAVCDTGNLVVGRDTITGGNEPNQPNTIFNSCADGTSGTFHVNASNDRVRVSTTDGTPFAPGKTVKIEATMWSVGAGTNFVDLYYAANASSPTWTFVTTLGTVAGIQTLSSTYVLPAGNVQAVRVVERSGGSADPCLAGVFNDRDDLVFAVTPAANTNLVQNGNFTNAVPGPSSADGSMQAAAPTAGTGPVTNVIPANWQVFATPDLSYIVQNVSGGVLQFSRNPPPPGTSNQATVFQETGVALPGRVPLLAQFDLGNTSTVRKYMKVLVIDSDFSDFAACTFWLPPSMALTTYQLKTYTTKAWANAAVYFYAGTANVNGDTGVYQVDNVSLAYAPAQVLDRTDCVDPHAPAPPGGAAGANLLTNGNFGTGVLTPWTTFGTVTQQITAGVLQMIRPSSTPPAGVVLQATTLPMPSGQLLTASFQLGNSSAVRKRVTTIMHDNDFSDLVACVFWLAPGQPLKTYSMVGWASKAWTNATMSFYPATIGPDQWTLVDNVTFQTTPSTATVGSNCIEPAGGAFPATGWMPGPSLVQAPSRTAPGFVAVHVSTGAQSSGGSVNGWSASGLSSSIGSGDAAASSGWQAAATPSSLRLEEPLDLTAATDARITFQSWLSARGSTAAVQVSTDGGANWLEAAQVLNSETWVPVDVDLAAYVGGLVEVRLVFDAEEPSDASDIDDFWRVDELQLAVAP